MGGDASVVAIERALLITCVNAAQNAHTNSYHTSHISLARNKGGGHVHTYAGQMRRHTVLTIEIECIYANVLHQKLSAFAK